MEGRSRTVDALDVRSPTGYADAQREIIIPERNEDSFDWVAETQQMFAQGTLRVHHVDTENAPKGRAVTAASPYRWWLGFIAWADHVASGRPIGLSVERAALYSDPLIQILFLVCAALFVAWRFGGLAAAAVALGIAAFFPFAAGFIAGMPDQRGLSCLLALVSVLVLLAGMRAQRRRAWFAVAGIVGGIGMWINVSTQAPVMVGIGLGALVAALVLRRAPGEAAVQPWRAWGCGAGVTLLLAYFAEFFPFDMGSIAARSAHPFFALALVGAGEVLGLAVPWIEGRKSWTAGRGMLALFAVAMAGVLAVPLWKAGGEAFLPRDLLWPNLSRLPGSPLAAGTGAWLAQGGLTLYAAATLLPVAALIPALWLIFRPSVPATDRAFVMFALCPAVVAGGFAIEQLGWWSGFGAAILALMVAVLSLQAEAARTSRWVSFGVAVAAAALGFGLLLPPKASAALTPREGEELIVRHLAHWLSERSGHTRPTVYAPPYETLGLWFYGDLKGVGTFSPDNRTGFGASLNIAAASNIEEVQNDLRALDVKYVVLPSWDPYFDEFARLYLDKRFADRRSLFAANLRRFNLPPWLRAVPYQLPVGGGFEGQSVLVFQVVDDQAPAAAAGRLAEYLVETGNMDQAAAAAEDLRRFPGDVGALAARAQVQGARGDAEGASATLKALLARVAAGGDRYLPWDRRVSLAIVLAQAGRNELSREQVRRCIAELNEERLRSLSTGSLYALLVLSHSFGVEITDPRLHALAPELLPADLRSRI